MINLKISTTYFSFFALLCVSLIFTSCQKESIDSAEKQSQNQVEEEQIDIPSIDHSKAIYLPKGYQELPEKELSKYMDNLSDEERSKLKGNYTIAIFLNALDLKKTIEDTMDHGSTFLDVDLSKWLNAEEQQKLKNFKPETMVVSRYCGIGIERYNGTWCAIYWYCAPDPKELIGFTPC